MGNNGSRSRRDKRSRECRNGRRRNSKRVRRVRDPYCCEFDSRPNPYYRQRRPPRCDDEVEVCDTICEPIQPIRPVDLACYTKCYVPPPSPPQPACYTPYSQYASSKQVICDYAYPQFEYPYTGYYCKTRCSTYPVFASPTSYRC